MASRKTLNSKNLEALGAKRLAELLLEISTGNAAAKRRLRLELAAAESPAEVAKEVRKRLTAITRSHSFIDWQKRRAFVEDLETQRRAIVEQVAKVDPAEGLELLWRFLSLANSVFERCDDSSGKVIDVFHNACGDLGEIALLARGDPLRLADKVLHALCQNDYGQYDKLIEVLAPALGEQGLKHLKGRFLGLSAVPVTRPLGGERKVVAWGSGGAIYDDEVEVRYRETTVRLALQEIADALGDVDGYIVQQSEAAKTVPKVAADIAQRLLAAGRTEEAWDAIDAIEEDRRGWIPYEWEKTRLEILEALGRAKEAQEFRWRCFEQKLDSSHLRAFLKKLPDFDDLEAEERALAYASGYPNAHQALAFLISWPALDQAATLVLERSNELDGNHYEVLTPAAEALAGKHPLAATAMLRAMVDFSLKTARSSRYRHAARHLAECESLAADIDDFGDFEPHEHYVARLEKEHRRKSSFWSRVP